MATRGLLYRRPSMRSMCPWHQGMAAADLVGGLVGVGLGAGCWEGSPVGCLGRRSREGGGIIGIMGVGVGGGEAAEAAEAGIITRAGFETSCNEQSRH